MLSIRYSNGEVDTKSLMRYLSFSGCGKNIFSEMIKQQEILRKARTEKIQVPDEKLQEYADKFRSLNNLQSTRATLEFLDNHGMDQDDFEVFCEIQVFSQMLREQMAPDEKINEFFVNNRIIFDRVRLSMIATQNFNLAKEVIMQVDEDGEDFHALARQHSIDEESKYNGGNLGILYRNSFLPELAAKIFNSPDNTLVGPVENKDFYQVFFVEKVLRAELTDDVKEQIKDILFDLFFKDFLKNGYKINL